MTRSLRVALDATPLSVPTGGVRRYTAELAHALSTQFPDDQYWLISDQPFEISITAPNLHRNPPASSFLERRWWAIGLPRELRRIRADVFHGVDFAVPYVPTRPSVMTIHDLSPWRAGLAESASKRVRRRTPLMLGLGLATMVITPTEAIRREAIAHFRIAPDRVRAVPLAASGLFRPVEPARQKQPYFLFVGTQNPRKNLKFVIEAWRHIRNEANLLVVGRADPADQAPGVTYLGALPDEDLPSLYSGAAAFLYPSTYEGFGLPVLEAMGCGAPVIASKDPAITEVAGGAAVHVDADDVHGWIAAMRSALTTSRNADQRERALSRAAQFTWARTAAMTREVYLEAIRRF